MDFIVINDPATLPWQTHLFDLTILIMFVVALVYAIRQYRAGNRSYAAMMVAAAIYGQVLELTGMATLNMYVQGQFAVMINWLIVPIFKGTTMFPLYGVFYYPVLLFTALKIVDLVGSRQRLASAIVAGSFTMAFDVPYVMQGTQPRMTWWTWKPDFTLFQFFLGEPYFDLVWHGVWDALFIFIVLWARPRVDGSGPASWSTRKVFGVFVPLLVPAVMVGGTVLVAPLAITTVLGGPQWPWMLLLLCGYAAVCVNVARSMTSPRIEPVTVTVVGVYAASFTIMLIANLVYEHRVTAYIAVQAVGLVVMCGFVLLPIARRRHAAAATANGRSGLASADV